MILNHQCTLNLDPTGIWVPKWARTIAIGSNKDDTDSSVGSGATSPTSVCLGQALSSTSPLSRLHWSTTDFKYSSLSRQNVADGDLCTWSYVSQWVLWTSSLKPRNSMSPITMTGPIERWLFTRSQWLRMGKKSYWGLQDSWMWITSTRKDTMKKYHQHSISKGGGHLPHGAMQYCEPASWLGTYNDIYIYIENNTSMWVQVNLELNITRCIAQKASWSNCLAYPYSHINGISLCLCIRIFHFS